VDNSRTNNWCYINYMKGPIEKSVNKLRKENVNIISTNKRNLKSLLCNYEEKTKNDNKSGVYKIMRSD